MSTTRFSGRSSGSNSLRTGAFASVWEQAATPTRTVCVPTGWDPVYNVPLMPLTGGGYEAVLPAGADWFTFFWTETAVDPRSPGALGARAERGQRVRGGSDASGELMSMTIRHRDGRCAASAIKPDRRWRSRW